MLRVSFFPAPVEVDYWNQAFQTPPCHQDAVVIIIVVFVVVVVVAVLTNGYIGNTISKSHNEVHDIGTEILVLRLLSRSSTQIA